MEQQKYLVEYGLSEKNICFKVVFKPISTWVDETYLGNMLTEVLGIVAKNTSAFEFDVEKIPNEPEKQP